MLGLRQMMVYFLLSEISALILKKGHTLGIVGESGSGKSQTVLSLMGLLAGNAVVSGQALFHDQNLINMPVKNLNKIRGDKISMIFQDPMTSLNPYLTIHKQLLEPLTIHKGMSHKEATKKVLEMLDAVQIPDAKNRLKLYPHEFSGGQCQRIGIVRALICEPKLLVCDEPVSALDVSIQAQVVNLLKELQKDFKLTILFVAHDLSIVKHISDKLFVMYLGSLVEVSPKQSIYNNPVHPYTKVLLNAIPIADPQLARQRTIEIEKSELPSPLNPPKGCAFHTRCKIATDICKKEHRSLISVKEDVYVACHNI